MRRHAVRIGRCEREPPAATRPTHKETSAVPRAIVQLPNNLGTLGIGQVLLQGSDQIHVVVMSPPGCFVRLSKDGHFPEGTTTVKEVFERERRRQDITTGTVSREIRLGAVRG